MNNLGFFFAALLASFSPEEERPPTKILPQESARQRMGEELLQEIRTAYLEGRYTTFLQELDQAYQEAKKSPSFHQFLDLRQSTFSSEEDQKWKQLFADWKKERDQKLLQAARADESSIYFKKISFISKELSPEEDTALESLAAYQLLVPGEGANADEETLIALDLEYEFKRIHLDSYAALDSNHSFEELRLQQDLLKMEEMDKLLAASRTFTDLRLKACIEQAAASLDMRLAQIRDSFDLYALLHQSERTPMEEALATILASYQTKYSDIYKELILGESAE